jgi:hypothetical protein
MISNEELCVEAMLNLERGYMFMCEIVHGFPQTKTAFLAFESDN